MNTERKTFIVALIVALAGSIACFSQDLNSTFGQALAQARSGKSQSAKSMMFDDFKQASELTIGSHTGPETVRFLKMKAEEPSSRKLALLSLARLGADDAITEIALAPRAYKKYGREPVLAAAFLPNVKGRRVAEALVSRSDSWRIRELSAELLLGLGDASTVSMLRELVADGDLKPPRLEKVVASTIINLEHRVTQVPPGRRASWAAQEVLGMRVLREVPLPRKVGGEYTLAAEVLHKQGAVFSKDFLEYKLRSGDLLGIALTGVQKENWAIESLAALGRRNDFVGDMACNALGAIGTTEALRAIEALILADERMSVAGGHILSLLDRYGDSSSAEILLQYAEDSRFTESQRDSMAMVGRSIQRRQLTSRQRLNGRSGREFR